MTPVQTLYRWFNDNPEATYKEALEAYEHCLELEQQLPQQEISDDQAIKMLKDMNKQPMRFHCVPKEISDEEIEKEASIIHKGRATETNWQYERIGWINGAKWYREQLKQRQ
jgi:hypothetical protein